MAYKEDDELRRIAVEQNQQPNAPKTQSVLDKILNRQPFSYDMNTDAVYNQMKDRYLQQGQMASQDAMGQAAALTGGYGNSYAQGVGTQAYLRHVQGLNDRVPDLVRLAQDRYDGETRALNNQYSLYLGQQKDNYNKLMGLITGVGYNPTEDEIAGAGMTQPQVDALLAAWNAAHAPADGGSGGYGGGGYGSGGRGSGANVGTKSKEGGRDTWYDQAMMGIGLSQRPEELDKNIDSIVNNPKFDTLTRDQQENLLNHADDWMKAHNRRR